MSDQQWPPVAWQTFEELRPMLALVRVMRRFLNEVIEPDPELKPHYARLDVAYAELLERELAPHACAMAEVLIALEDAYTADAQGSDVQQ